MRMEDDGSVSLVDSPAKSNYIEMEKNEMIFTEKMGPAKYKETLATLTEIKASEEKRG